MEHKEYIKETNGDTAVLFIHGICGTPAHFKDFIPLIPPKWSVYNILLDGHGKGVYDFSASSMKKWRSQVLDRAKELCCRYNNVYIAAHSMGTLFAIEAALMYPEKIKALFLLAVPLRLFVRPIAGINSLKVIFNKISPQDVRACAARDAYGIAPDRRLLLYLGWIPRYFELFGEIRRIRRKICSITTYCYAYQSKMDELVSLSACKHLKQNPNIKTTLLQGSGHYYYEKEDFALLQDGFCRYIIGRYCNENPLNE